jgi:hypothetical protein
MRVSKAFPAFAVLLTASSPLMAVTVDQRLKRLPAGAIELGDKITDHCRDTSHDVTITTTTDGEFVLKAGDVKYFEIKKSDDYTRGGGWCWMCGSTGWRSKIGGATYIKAERSAVDGSIVWQVVKLKGP